MEFIFIFLNSFTLRFVSQNWYILLWSQEEYYCRMHFSSSMLAGFHLGLFNVRHWQQSREWLKRRIQDMCLHFCLSKVVSLTTTVLLPSLQVSPENLSMVPTSPSWFWPPNSGATTSSLCHLGWGVLMVVCFLLFASFYTSLVLCLSSFITYVTSSLH